MKRKNKPLSLDHHIRHDFQLLGLIIFLSSMLLPLFSIAAHAQVRCNKEPFSDDIVCRDNYGNTTRGTRELSGDIVYRDGHGNFITRCSKDPFSESITCR
jgi:hypothetical protein